MKKVETLQAPAAIGPYSQAIVAGGMVFVSGQIPLRPDGSLETGDVETQTHRVMKNLQAVLEAAGSGLSKVVQTTCYLRDMNDFAAFNKVYGEYFSAPFPARATIQVARLPRDVAVEVACIALT
jgi:2-iminobutanoate/2-iminopropanoate deaminase